MKLCETCRFGSEYELDKPCVVYREDCPLYQKVGDGMTNEKAIEELKAIKSAYSNKQQFHEACLMRSEHEALDMAIKALEQEQSGDLISRQYLLDNCVVDKVTMPYVPISKIQEAPSVNPQAPKGKCILSQKYKDWQFIQELKTGHWNEVFNDIEGEVRFYCSECNDYQMFTSRYCPNCGAKMESEG